jgi:hypothetical protein
MSILRGMLAVMQLRQSYHADRALLLQAPLSVDADKRARELVAAHIAAARTYFTDHGFLQVALLFPDAASRADSYVDCCAALMLCVFVCLCCRATKRRRPAYGRTRFAACTTRCIRYCGHALPAFPL